MRKFLGFTLIEVLVTVAIVAILAAIAIPSYSQYVQKTRRTDAQEKLLDLAAQQERWFFNKNQYTINLAVVCLMFFLIGPGAISLDAMLF